MTAERAHDLRPAGQDPKVRRETLAALLTEVAQQLAEDPPPAPEPARHAMTERVLLTPEEAGEQLGVGRSTVYALIKAGQLESVQIGRLRRVPTSALREYAERLIEHTRSQGH